MVYEFVGFVEPVSLPEIFPKSVSHKYFSLNQIEATSWSQSNYVQPLAVDDHVGIYLFQWYKPLRAIDCENHGQADS